MNYAARTITNLTRWVWMAVAVGALGCVAVATMLWVTDTLKARIDVAQSQLASLSTTNRVVFCNTERLLLIRAVQNGYTIPSGAAVDACGLPIIGNPPLPAEGPTFTPGVTALPTSAATRRPSPSGAPTATPSPTATPRPSPSPTPTPLVCIVGICPR